MLLSNTSVGNMTIEQDCDKYGHTTSECSSGFRSTHLLNAARGMVLKSSRTLMKSLMECLSNVIFMTSKNDLHQRDETLFAKKFRRAEMLCLKDPQTIISEVGSCYRYNLGARDIPVTESVRCGSGSLVNNKIAEDALIPRHCRSR